MKLPRSVRRPRVLVINKFYPPFVGGVEKVAADIVAELSDKFDFHVLACQSRGKRSVERQGNVTVERCAAWGTVRSMPVSFEFLRRYQQLAPQFDLVHFHEPFPLGTLCGVAFGFRHAVVTFHSDVLRQRILKQAYIPLRKLLLRKVNAIMPTSSNLGRHIKVLRQFRETVRPVPLGIENTNLVEVEGETGEIQSLRKRFSSTCLYLAVGRCVGYKGFNILIDAFSKLDRGDLVIVGDGPLRSSLQQRARDRGVASRVHFAGKLSDRELALHFHACDVFVLPSVLETEAFGLVQLEAMACGKPVINTDLPTGVPYVSLHGETGITVPVGQINPLAKAMRHMCDDSQMREAFGRNAKRRFLDNFQRSQMGENVLAVYREVLGDSIGQLSLTEERRKQAA